MSKSNDRLFLQPRRLLGLTILMLAASAEAKYVHQVWTTREGLPVNSVTDVLQSRQGYLWLTTFDGLVRYDGARFVTYTESTTPGLGNNRLTSLVELADGKLLLASEVGDLSVFDPGTGSARLLSSAGRTVRIATIGPDGDAWVAMRPGIARVRDGRLESVAQDLLGDADVIAIAFDRSGDLWLGTRGRGVWHFPASSLRAPQTRHTDAPVVYTRAKGLRSDIVLSVLIAADGTVWVGTDRGVDAIRHDGITPLTAEGKPWDAYLHQITQHPRDGLLFATEAGLFHYLPDGPRSAGPERVDPTDLRRSPRNTVLQASDGAVWLATATTVLRDGVPVFRVPAGERAGIRAMTFDHEGNVWFATTGSGLHQLRRAVFEAVSVEEGLSSREVYPLAEDSLGTVWVGTQKGGLSRVEGGRASAVAAPGLLDDNIKAILEDRAGTLWVGTYEAGLFRREGDRFVPEPIVARHDSPEPLRVFALFEDHAGALWAGTSAGLHRRLHGRWARVDAAAPGELPVSAFVRVIRETADGALWVGTHGAGVGRLAGGRLTWITIADGLTSNRVRDLFPAEGNVVWVATEDRGLNRVTWAAGAGKPSRIVSVRAANGLPDDGIHQILSDDYGWLWMSTNHGIFRVLRKELDDVADGRRQRLTADLFTERDGMRNREANGGVQGTALRARDGRLWFATVDGVVIADPDPRRFALPAVRLTLETLTANSREHPLGGAITLVPDDRSFRIDYTAFSFTSPDRIRFRYRLDGFDRDWMEVGTRRTAFYTNVPAGNYRFRLQASSSTGSGQVWSGDEAVAPLTVQPFIHETLWFRALLAILALAALFLAHLLRTGWLERQRQELIRQVELRTRELAAEKTVAVQRSLTIAEQAEQLRELDRQKSRFFADISHELRTPLTLIIGPLEDAQRDLKSTPVAEATSPAITGAIRNAHSLLDLTNQLLDLSKLEAGKFELDLRDEDLTDLLRHTAERFTPLARQRGVAFAQELPVVPVIAHVDRRQLGRVIDNLLSNAFKFTPRGGAVRLTLSAGAGKARIDVIDSGAGIAAVHLPRIFERFYQADDPSGRLQPGTGIGLALVRELTTLHGGELEVASEVGTGTRFAVILPLTVPVAADARGPALTELAAASHDPREAEPVSVEGELDRTTVLIVDDEEEIRAYLRRHLEPRYRVLEAADGEAGLAIAREALPDLVVADVMMPRLDGFGLCREIKSDPELDFVPVILLTARAGTGDRLEGLGLLADDYVTKPFDARELLARADNLIALRRRLRERFASASIVPDEPPADATADFVPAKPSEDELYRQRLFALIDRHLSDEEFRVADLARLMAQDRTHLFRRAREVTGEAPSDLIRARRLSRAADLLRTREGQVAEVAYAVGFNSVSYFIKCFREDYGMTPARYASGATGPS